MNIIPYDTVRSCSLCSLRKKCQQPLINEVVNNPEIMVVFSKVIQEDDFTQKILSSIEGKYIKKIFEEESLLDKTYFTHLTKCYSDDTILKYHIDECKGWLWKEIKAVQPKIIITMGKMASSVLLKVRPNKLKLSEIEGNYYNVDYCNALIYPWFDPTYILNRNDFLNKKFLKGIYAKLVV